MGQGTRNTKGLPVRVYQRLAAFGQRPSDAKLLAKFQVFLKDRPGSLAAFASLIARHGGNISFFHYDRAMDPNRVAVEVQMTGRPVLEALVDALSARPGVFRKSRFQGDNVEITSLANVLEFKVRLEHRPGTLAALARLLRRHQANVIYMLYDEAIDPQSADIALATRDPEEIHRLLGVMNDRGYQYRVLYRGSDAEEVNRLIGLKLVEKLFLRLRKLLSDRDVEELKAMVESSRELSADLVEFYSELGSHLEDADVFEKVLTLASLAATKKGERFSAREMAPVKLTNRVRLLGFRMPTSENIYVFEHDGELSMVDTGYGVYYDNIKSLLRDKALDPARLRRIFVTHPDADHAGASGYFARELGARVFMHPMGKSVVDSIDRGYGAEGRVARLNRCFSRIVNRLTKCEYPGEIHYFSPSARSKEGAFRVVDTFFIGDLEFQVLESLGGHIHGLVFFLNRSHGLLFTSDYLIRGETLTPEDRENLSVYSYLLTSPNLNRDLYREETAALLEMAEALDGELRRKGKSLLILPGHGDYYPLSLEKEHATDARGRPSSARSGKAGSKGRARR